MRKIKFKKIKRVRELRDKIFQCQNVSDLRYMIKQLPMVTGYGFWPLNENYFESWTVFLDVKHHGIKKRIVINTTITQLQSFKYITELYYQYWINHIVCN